METTTETIEITRTQFKNGNSNDIKETTTEIRIIDIEVDITVIRAVNQWCKTHGIDYNPYWDEDELFLVKNDSLLPLSRMDNIMSGTFDPPLFEITKKGNHYTYENGRHRHARMLIHNLCKPNNLANDYVIEKNPGPSSWNKPLGRYAYSTYVSPEEFSFLDKIFKAKAYQVRNTKSYDPQAIGRRYFIVDRDRYRALRVSCEYFKDKHWQSAKAKRYFKFHSSQDFVALAFRDKISSKSYLTSEGLWSTLKSPFELYKDFSYVVDNAKSAILGIDAICGDPHTKYLIIDFSILIIDIINTPGNVTSICSSIVKICVLCSRLSLAGEKFVTAAKKNIASFESESFNIGFNDLAIMFSSLGLPEWFIKIVKDFNLLTGKRIQDTSLIQPIGQLLTLIVGTIRWITEKLGIDAKYTDHLTGMVTQVIDYVDSYTLVKKLSNIHHRFVVNSQLLFDPDFRQEISVLDEELRINPAFQEMIIVESNKYMHNIYQSFKVNMVKALQTFGSARRLEPVCVVFEGEPAAGKSALMNSYVDLLKEDNKTVYVHTVPPNMGGKDFYDDYLNQDVFVMDDVGQQDISQWRTIINLVAPIVAPLDCAASEKKNTKSFNSGLILCTTNAFMSLTGFTKGDGIANREALYRRGHVFKVSRIGNDKQKVSYHRYDLNTKNWVATFPPRIKELSNHPVEIVTPLEGEAALEEKLTWMHVILCNLEQDRLAFDEQSRPKTSMLRRVLEKTTTFFDSEALYDSDGDDDCFDENFEPEENETLRPTLKPYFDVEGVTKEEVKSWKSNRAGNGLSLLSEWVKSSKVFLYNMARTIADTMREKLMKLVVSISRCCIEDVVNVIGTISLYVVSGLIVQYAYERLRKFWNKEPCENQWQHTRNEWNKLKPLPLPAGFESETGFDMQRLNAMQLGFRFIKSTFISGKEPKEIVCQALVSGRRIILPLHAFGVNTTVDIYRTWDSADNNNAEGSAIRLKVIQTWPDIDLAVLEMEGFAVPPYRKCSAAFNKTDVKLCRDLFFLNVGHCLPLTYGSSGNINMNTSTVEIRNFSRAFTKAPGTMLHYPYSSPGFCGSAIVSKRCGIVGFHLAGNGKVGSAMILSTKIRDEIANLMLAGSESPYDTRVINKIDYSGARLDYLNGDIKISRVIGDTTLAPTILHTAYNEETAMLCAQYNDYVEKGPPNFKSLGTPHQTLIGISEKSFSPIGTVDPEELAFAKQVLASFFVPFSPITNHRTAFGGEGLTSLKRDSSNGYGWKTGKSTYFDFENHSISDEFLNFLNEFQDRCEADEVKITDVLSKESFKDELRMPTKRDSPRTFRVLPLHHIFLTKKYLAELLLHIKKEMWKNGIAIGMNPYKDWARLYSELNACSVVFDIDFSKWDGKCHPLIQEMVNEVVLSFFNGNERETKTLDILLKSIVRGHVLVSDQLMRTTHSMPSGTWVTALFNSLFNKAISAMALYRSMKKDGKTATVADFSKLVDFAMGDDKLCGAPLAYERYFNAFTVKSVADSLGMDCTDGNKKPIVTKGVPLSDIVFLKRKFKYHVSMNTIVGPLDVNTILNSIQWANTDKDYLVVMRGKCVAAQVEGYLHSPLLKDTLYNLFSSEIPSSPFMSVERIRDIMASDTGYMEIQRGLDKDYDY